MNNNIDELLRSEEARVEKIHEIVRETISEGLMILEKMTNPEPEKMTFAQRISDKVAKFGGSWSFIIWFSAILAFWVVFNSMMPTGTAFDPFPFILMNLVLSAVAALQAPIIMMSQNRQEEKDREHSEYDHRVNLKAELEIRGLNKKLDLLLIDQINILFESQTKQLEVLKRIEDRMNTMQK